MISFDEALGHVLAEKKSFGEEKIPLSAAMGRILAEDIHSDRDAPPFDRVMMDGIAVAHSSLPDTGATFIIEGIQAAGHRVSTLHNTLTGCIEVMTGAPLPENTDTVIPYEKCVISNGRATVPAGDIEAGQNIHFRASDWKAGDRILTKGKIISVLTVGLLASFGYAEISVQKLPKIAICSTGDELIDIDQTPEPYQIRRSNTYMLAAALQKEGIDARLFHLADNLESTIKWVAKLKADFDALLFSGAVSKGKFDYLPDALATLGMRTIFHSVAQKPGKPFLFGSFDGGPLIFGFPGNPISTFACYQVYFRSWLTGSLGRISPMEKGIFGCDMELKGTFSRFVLVDIKIENAQLKVQPETSANSGDLRGLANSKGFAIFRSGKSHVKTGELVEIIRF
ncbi:MAG: molybdopterin molybdotransferase MoeA [Mucilaginibacter polytrichastri]|nr:molybdopterin molybdotransferase MoeA [Mucilaginibacter polytrichastri]